MSDILKDLEKDIEKRRKNEQEKEKRHLLSQLGDRGVKAPKFSKDIAYIAIIILLVSYTAYDRILVHPSLSLKSGEDITSLVAENAEIVAETTTTVAEETTTTTIAEKPALSGSVSLQLVDINKEKISDTAGQIQSVIFIIENGLEKPIYPVINVYAYDDELAESWHDISRGAYNGDKSIKVEPGKNHTGSIFLTPKTFSNLDLIKTVELSLKYSDDKEPIKVKDKIKIG